jgi:hypothetical protein
MSRTISIKSANKIADAIGQLIRAEIADDRARHAPFPQNVTNVTANEVFEASDKLASILRNTVAREE